MATEYPTYVGWYQPHPSIDEDNLAIDPKTGELTELPSMTKQSFVAECDINNIIRDFQLSGQVAHINARAQQGAYLDLPDTIDFQESFNLVRQAQDAFDTLPAKIRANFDNDPAQFLAYVQDPANHAQLVTWGLANAPETPLTGGNEPPIGGSPTPPLEPSKGS